MPKTGIIELKTFLTSVWLEMLSPSGWIDQCDQKYEYKSLVTVLLSKCGQGVLIVFTCTTPVTNMFDLSGIFGFMKQLGIVK